MKTLSIAAMILLLASPVLAHSKVTTSSPADGAVLEHAPKEIVLNFGAKIRLTRVLLGHADASPSEVALDGHSGFAENVSLPLQTLDSGSYVIEWRGLGVDGHAMQGTLQFSIK